MFALGKFDLSSGVRHVGLRPGDVRLAPRDCGGKLPRINDVEFVSRLDFIAFLEEYFIQIAFDAGSDFNHFHGIEVAVIFVMILNDRRPRSCNSHDRWRRRCGWSFTLLAPEPEH